MTGGRNNGWLRKIADMVGRDWLDKRGRRRLRADFGVTIELYGCALRAQGVDASRQGIGVVSEKPLPPGILVFLELTDADLSGFAHVRHCTSRPDGKFKLGLKFRDQLHCRRSEIGQWTHLQVTTYGACGAWDNASETPVLTA